MNDIWMLIIGWLLGLLSPSIVLGIRNEYKRREVRSGIESELKELLNRMATVVSIIALRFGRYDKELVEWLIPLFEGYKGVNPSENILQLLKKQQKLDDKQFAEIVAYEKVDSELGLAVKKYKLPYLESKIGELSIFSEKSQRQALEILTNLHLFNEEVEEARFYFKLTYDSGISEENHLRASEGGNASYRNIGKRARIIVDRIKKYQEAQASNKRL